MAGRLFDVDPTTGLTTHIEYNNETDRFLFTYSQDVNQLLDAAKATQNEAFDKRADMWHAASIPPVVQLEWLTKHGVDLWDKNHKDGVKRLLNDPDYRYLKVRNIII